MSEYQKPELVDLKNSKAAGTCGNGSAPAQTDCFVGMGATSVCNVGNLAVTCQTGSTAA